MRCTESDFIKVTELAKKNINLNQTNWHYLELASSHIPMATIPKN